MLYVSDNQGHPVDGYGSSVDPGGHADSHRLEPHRPHQVLTICGSCCQGRIIGDFLKLSKKL